ncbi:hypothetical protein VUR80DRAFT_2142 [Thermomyces stellatus]
MNWRLSRVSPLTAWGPSAAARLALFCTVEQGKNAILPNLSDSSQLRIETSGESLDKAALLGRDKNESPGKCGRCTLVGWCRIQYKGTTRDRKARTRSRSGPASGIRWFAGEGGNQAGKSRKSAGPVRSQTGIRELNLRKECGTDGSPRRCSAGGQGGTTILVRWCGTLAATEPRDSTKGHGRSVFRETRSVRLTASSANTTSIG